MRHKARGFAGTSTASPLVSTICKTESQRLHDDVKAVLPVNGADVMAHSTRVLYLFLSRVSAWHRRSAMEVGLARRLGIAPSRSVSGHAMLLANPTRLERRVHV